MNVAEFLRLARQIDGYFHSNATWEAKYELILDLAPQVRATGVGVHYADPDTTYEEDVTAYVKAVAEKAEEYRKALESLDRPESRDERAELIKLRTGVARLAMRAGLAEFVPGAPGREAHFERIVQCAEDNPRGWNALIARLMDKVVPTRASGHEPGCDSLLPSGEKPCSCSPYKEP